MKFEQSSHCSDEQLKAQEVYLLLSLLIHLGFVYLLLSVLIHLGFVYLLLSILMHLGFTQFSN